MRTDQTIRRSACPLHVVFDLPRGEERKGITAAGVAAAGFGLVAYAAFVCAFLYAACFVGNWIVPKTIDSGPESGVIESVAVNVGILLLFVVQHTVMARRWFKRWWTAIVPASIERSIYVLAASAILGLLFWQWRPLPSVVWSVESPVPAWCLSIVSLAGYGIAFASSFMVNHFDLFGIRQVLCRLMGTKYEPVGFRLKGLYRLVRHPLMVGFLIGFWATPRMTVGHLLFSILVTAYIAFGTWIEERDLIAEHGESYLAYRRSVPGFIPLARRGA